MAHILVADDEGDILELATMLLELEGHTVERVMRGDQVIDAIDQYRPDVLVLDLMLPGKDGLRLIRQLAVEYRGLPVVVITAYPLARAVEHLTQAGFHPKRVSFLAKPFENAELVANVQLALAENTG